ncbi:MAG: DUF1295 domain-containing protein [Pseudomonadota bacterium]
MDERLIFDILLAALFALSAIIFALLTCMSAPYGRHGRKGWGPGINARVGWVIQELPAVVVVATCFFLGDRKTSLVAIVFLCMWLLHYVQRTFVFSVLMRGRDRTFPLLLMVFSIIFNTANGYLNGRWLFTFSHVYEVSWLADPRFLTGLLIFLAGFVINVHSDGILRRLRKPGAAGYGIPHGGLFDYVSGANYFGEILEWTGWAVATWSLPGLAFAAFTVANLAPRANTHHAWYRKQFSDYPRKRKAIIPFIW